MSNSGKGRPAFNRDNSRSLCIKEGLAFLAQTTGKTTNNIPKRKAKRIVVFEAAQHVAKVNGRKSARKTRSARTLRGKLVNRRRQALNNNNNNNVNVQPAPKARSTTKKIRKVIPPKPAAVPKPVVNNNIPVVHNNNNNAGFNFGAVAVNPGNAMSNLNALPTSWRFSTPAPAFGLYVDDSNVFCGDNQGNIYQFSHEGDLKNHLKLPYGVKSIVRDYQWLYAGCDNGVVYDVTDKDQPRIAYEIPEDGQFDEHEVMANIDDLLHDHEATSNNEKGARQKLTTIRQTKKKHVVFALDTSSSMSSNRQFESALANMKMIFNHHMQDHDIVSFVTFDSVVSVKFENMTKSTDRAQIMTGFDSARPSGATALWDAIQRSVELVTKPQDTDVDRWIICLTDGEDNRSTARPTALSQLLNNKKQTAPCNLVLIDVLHRPRPELKQLCDATEHGLYIPVHSSKGIEEAFKLVAQVLNAKVLWMDVSDGLLAVSDNRGSVTVCNIEGEKMWSQKSEGKAGWMVRADASAIYHGHSQGIDAYSLRSGDKRWQVKLPEGPVMSGTQSREFLFAATGPLVQSLDKEGKLLMRTPSGQASVTATALAPDQDNEDGLLIVAAGTDGSLTAYDSVKGTQKWSFSLGGGSALSVAARGSRVFVVTTNGQLICGDVSNETVKKALAGNFANAARNITAPENSANTIVPTNQVDTINTPLPDGSIVVECSRALSDADVMAIHNAIHSTADHVTIQGVDWPVNVGNANCRFIRWDDALTFIEQNKTKTSKYAKMSRDGHKITWIIKQGRWGLIIDDKIEHNGTKLKVRVSAKYVQQFNQKFDVNWDVQFPNELREEGAEFVVDELVQAENGNYYRVKGNIKRVVTANNNNNNNSVTNAMDTN
jgi:Mg-chelatase subunit ChlD